VALALGGCATQLAPVYDASIAGSLSTANNDIQALFVAVGSDADASTFATRKPAYDHIVAELSATLIEIKARPIPNPQAMAEANNALQQLHVGGLTVDPGFSDYPSARSVSDLTDTIKHMEAADQQSGLHHEAVPAFEQQATIFLTQAITYENFLKR
jgi:hypothetical protein